MNDPIVVWPPGTFTMTCGILYLRDCTADNPWLGEGYIACCMF